MRFLFHWRWLLGCRTGCSQYRDGSHQDDLSSFLQSSKSLATALLLSTCAEAQENHWALFLHSPVLQYHFISSVIWTLEATKQGEVPRDTQQSYPLMVRWFRSQFYASLLKDTARDPAAGKRTLLDSFEELPTSQAINITKSHSGDQQGPAASKTVKCQKRGQVSLSGSTPYPVLSWDQEWATQFWGYFEASPKWH